MGKILSSPDNSLRQATVMAGLECVNQIQLPDLTV